MGSGSKMMISISKIKNKTARRKNRKENGRRAFEDGENPHSNGLFNSRSFHWVVDEMLSREKTSLRNRGIINARNSGIIIVIIDYGRSRGRLLRNVINMKIKK